MLHNYDRAPEPDAWRILCGVVFASDTPGEGPITIDPGDDERRDKILHATTLFLSSQWPYRNRLIHDQDVLRTDCPHVARLIDGLFPDKEDAADYIGSISRYLALQAMKNLDSYP